MLPHCVALWTYLMADSICKRFHFTGGSISSGCLSSVVEFGPYSDCFWPIIQAYAVIGQKIWNKKQRLIFYSKYTRGDIFLTVFSVFVLSRLRPLWHHHHPPPRYCQGIIQLGVFKNWWAFIWITLNMAHEVNKGVRNKNSLDWNWLKTLFHSSHIRDYFLLFWLNSVSKLKTLTHELIWNKVIRGLWFFNLIKKKCIATT